ncbi:type II secretion system F family protein [Paludisphaera rhizosphaerae]|uniref:type II secretion system F family protein n=1 Tax=Paludisphaera rhizosphaerae TaxID=2711216 RepID=UPI0013E9AA7B|nr:type II secretion system F family protein [Paludisphaera rhizosphaerae]
MSLDPEDPQPTPPRRPRPKPGSNPDDAPPRDPPRAGAGDSVFRPTPGSSSDMPKRRRKSSDGPPVLEVAEPGPKWYERIVFGRVSSGQLAQFCRQFGSYLNAGVDYDRALSSLHRQFQRTGLGPVIERMRTRIQAGATLEDATKREQDVFGPAFQSMIKVAEARGAVPETLKMLGESYEYRQRLIRQARSAMIYPIIVLFLASTIAMLLSIYLLPMFASMLADISKKGSLPFASQALMAFSGFVQRIGWWLLPVLLVGVPLALLRWYRTSAGKAVLDPIVLRIPVIGSIFRKLDVSRFARTLASLLDAGVDVGSAMDLTAQALAMTPIRKEVAAAKKPIMEGRDLSVALSRSRWFGPDVIAVLESGEETGKIPESLGHVADDYEEQASYMVKNLGHLIQPLMILMLGGFVLFIILAVFLPYIQMISSLAGG